ncbi:hypothetical protein [Methylobacterium sp. WL8]|uniref:hypothetical protein n=1 Tax=Methylobacterium sp. WL8 TaxID=2603899 RepID=UPI0011CA004C|nr:hypothetical protein [Methylobacterium sp. WL8]TXN83311.1 hypothetical protein FV234_07100 [Methylobacterium sp. WL8]
MPNEKIMFIGVRAAAAVALSLQTTTKLLAQNRQPVGGAFLNSYTSDPYFDPKSAYSQRRSLGDLGGQPLEAIRGAPESGRSANDWRASGEFSLGRICLVFGRSACTGSLAA